LPAGAHGTGFGLLSGASLAGLALSPVVSGALSTTGFRFVFFLDIALLVGLGLTFLADRTQGGLRE
jgi:F0F1-type ATP synthase membrane subunit c/vacuolar-type H+-ATPase subunit K